VRRLLDLGMQAVREGLLPVHEDQGGNDQPPSPGEDEAPS
jgi:hypothetical protein